MLDTIKFGLVVGCAALIVGCGGGGGSVPIPAAKAPTVSISLSAAKVAVNAQVTVTWASTDASSCVGTDALPATQPINGSASVTQAAGGQFTYTITCTGAGGSATAKVTGIVPMKVFATSYENKNSIPFDRTQIQSFQLLGIARDPDEIWENPRDMTFGDFFQTGQYSAFAVSVRSRNLYGVVGLPDVPGKAYFLSLDSSGKWVDRTTELLKTPADRDVCVSASFSLTADFNNDGKPDVYVACHGLDYDLGITDPIKQKAVYTEHQVLFLSQPDGTYKRIDVPFQIYGHQAALGDINGDGFVDVLTTNSMDFTGGGADITPFVMLGKGDGTFVRDNTIVPASIYDYSGRTDGIWGVQLIPVSGRLDAVIGGGNTVWLKGNGKGGFDVKDITVLPTMFIPTTGAKYLFPLDVIYQNGFFYLSQLSQYATPSVAVVRKINASTLAESLIFQNSTPFPNDSRIGSEQYKPTSDGYLVPVQGGCNKNFSDPQFAQSICGLKIKLN